MMKKKEYESKLCKKCGVNLVYLKAKYPSYCLECKNLVNREVYNKKSHLDRKFLNAKRNFKLNKDDFIELIKKEKCEICGKKIQGKDLKIDHDHKTNQVRGILCNECNLGIAYFKENPNLFKKAMHYLAFHRTQKKQLELFTENK